MSPRRPDATDLTLSHEEAWVAHAALLDACERAVDTDGDASPYHRPLDRIERGGDLPADGTALLRDALVDYLGDAPVRDRAPGRALLRRTADAVDSAPRRV
ncbi:hypothetical protein DQW50_01455 [Halorubrum sp. 48-1-W]|uniref:DUF7853 family protein n=1 Tax=Halorubrum sp. 48-1-W TaxID=2249761 RepID=UPI000DCF2774|nr:hypothetical protein [Halorubrum sp. 48-1-W]RAW47073.1 hypothetical protein DQW50_01455 [Halorubrum sp. 48-1-W]